LPHWNCPHVHGGRGTSDGAKELGVEIKVETRGSVGAENEITPEDLK
jgi:hypothetical protein